MSIIILGDLFSFPEGNAATNRVFTYAKGFLENGITPEVVCFSNEYNEIHQGVASGINFYYPFRQRKRSQYFIVRRWRKFVKYLNAYRILKEINRKDQITAIICYSDLFLTLLFSFVLSRYLKTKLIIECNEYPLKRYLNGFLRRVQGELKVYFDIIICDSIFCISQYLVDFYVKKGVARHKLFLVPSTVDPARFNGHRVAPLPYEYILYCGSLTIMKDGVNRLIESFSRISARYPELKLVLIGKGDTREEEVTIRQLVTHLQKEHEIVFMGQLSRTEIPAYLSNAKILALARPPSKIADAGFPSKLTEYLATGNPIAVSAVGEIPHYLHNDVNAFLPENDGVDSFAEVLDNILMNYDHAKVVGKKGKELTDTVFNYNFQAKRMIEYIKTL